MQWCHTATVQLIVPHEEENRLPPFMQATKLLKEKLEAVLAEAHKRVDSETFTDVHWRGASLPVKSDRLRTAITSAIEKSKQLRCGARVVCVGSGVCGNANFTPVPCPFPLSLGLCHVAYAPVPSRFITASFPILFPPPPPPPPMLAIALLLGSCAREVATAVESAVTEGSVAAAPTAAPASASAGAGAAAGDSEAGEAVVSTIRDETAGPNTVERLYLECLGCVAECVDPGGPPSPSLWPTRTHTALLYSSWCCLSRAPAGPARPPLGVSSRHTRLHRKVVARLHR